MVVRCVRCRMRGCLCEAIPRIETRTELLIVRHASERSKPSNTAHFARLALTRCALVEYGVEESPFDEAQLTGDGRTWVLYPDGPADPPAGERPDRLIVLDGSWSQANRMRRRIQALRGLPFLRLPPPAAGRLRLRRPLHPQGMSTLEAIAGAIALLEGPERARPLDELHDTIVRAWFREATRLTRTPAAR